MMDEAAPRSQPLIKLLYVDTVHDNPDRFVKRISSLTFTLSECHMTLWQTDSYGFILLCRAPFLVALRSLTGGGGGTNQPSCHLCTDMEATIRVRCSCFSLDPRASVVWHVILTYKYLNRSLHRGNYSDLCFIYSQLE